MSGQPSTSMGICLAVADSDDLGPACLLRAGPQTLLGRLVGQLHHLGVTRVIVLTRPRWAQACAQVAGADVEVEGHPTLSAMLGRIAELTDEAAADLLLVHADVLTHDGVLAGLVADPRVRSGVLSTTKAVSPLLCPPVRISRGRIVASASAYHRCERPNASLMGMCKVGHADLGEAAAAARELAGLVASGLPDQWSEEFAGKVADQGSMLLAAQAGRLALADQLSAADPLPDHFPSAADLRAGLAADYRRTVAAPAEALRDDPLPLLVVGLVRRDVLMAAAYLRELYWGRPVSADAADAAYGEMCSVDEDAVLLDSAVKATDGFFTTFLVSPYSRYIARWAARRGLTPNQVTTGSMALGLLAAAAFATGSRAGMIVGAILLQLAFTADCVDGQLARYTRQFSKLGAWLDSVFDRGKEYVVYAGLAIGAAGMDVAGGIWFLAAAALALQTFRHYVDFSYAAQQHQALAASVRGSLKTPEEGGIADWEEHAEPREPATGMLQRLGRTGIRTSVAFERRPWMKWAKRIIVLPIGERFALISVTAAVWGPRTTFMSLLVWGTIAALYTTVGRMLRSFA